MKKKKKIGESRISTAVVIFTSKTLKNRWDSNPSFQRKLCKNLIKSPNMSLISK